MGFDGTSAGFGGGGQGSDPAVSIEIDVTEITGGTSGYILKVNADGTLGQINPATYTGFPIQVDTTNVLSSADYAILFTNPTTGTLGASANFGYIESSSGLFNNMSSSTATTQASLQFSKSRASTTIIVNGDRTGTVTWSGYDGAAYQATGAIEGIAAGTVSAGNVPQALQFLTSATNAAAITTKMFIGPTGIVGIGWGGWTTDATAIVDIKASATGSVEAFRIRNNANDANYFKVLSDGLINFGSSGSYTDSTGQFALSTSGSGAGLLLGGDALLYRSAADVLRTPDSLLIDSRVGIGDTISSTRRLYIYNPTGGDTGLHIASDGASTISANIVNSGSGSNIALIVNSFNGTTNYALVVANGDINFNTTTGSKIGTSVTEKFAFWDAAPVVQQANTVAIDTLIATLGLRATGGAANFDTRVQQKQGADVASATNLTLGSDGNAFEITGTTTIDLILITGWQNGSVITLVFNESLTVRHGIATSGSNVTILLAGAANFSATANDTLTLMLCETTAGGQAWREIARAAI